MTERLRRLATHGLAAAAAVMAAGCDLSREARDTFVRRHYCPSERVTVTERPDRRYHREGYWYHPEMPPPPPDVQADPERLAIYQELWRSKSRYVWPADDPSTYFEVEGCGKRAVYECRTGRRLPCGY
jgi:hypothetical protein